MTNALLSWFARDKRDLPWRHRRTPYRVWVAEVMLQQTQAATVSPYFKRWMARFPDLGSLAAASLDEVLKAWEGLGYYRRARLLHRAARQVMSAHGGRLPERYAELLTLPGIGSYTAAAIASLAFGERVLAVDGNVKRVAARLFMLPGQPGESKVRAALEPLLPATRAGAFNEALMELGATVCTPFPDCPRCPVKGYCAAYGAGRVAEFPNPKLKRVVPQLSRFALIYRRNGALWLYRRGEEEMLGGLWGFPLIEASSGPAPQGRRLKPLKHAYTHFRITAQPVIIEAHPAKGLLPGAGRFVSTEDISTLALSKLDHKIYEAFRAAEDAEDSSK